jgi:hypothetical protein
MSRADPYRWPDHPSKNVHNRRSRRAYARPVDAALQEQADNVLVVLSRVQRVFGGDRPPADPPAFLPPRDLEDNLGRGSF